MNTLQISTIIIYGLISILAFIKGFFEVTKKNNPFGETPFLLFLGIFVWSDAVMIGFFGFLISLICLLIGDWILFLLIISIFWVVRSLGEIIYWINEQFRQLFEIHLKLCWDINFLKMILFGLFINCTGKW